MNLHPTDEEVQLQETMRRFAADRAGVEPGDDAARYDRAARDFAALGGAGMAIAEERGGFGFSPESIALAAFELGAMPLAAPRIEQVVAVARLLDAAPAAATLRERFVGGDASIVLADWEGHGVHGFTKPTAEVIDGRLTGTKAGVIGAMGANAALVTALLDGEPALFAVSLADCVDVAPLRLADRTPAADLTFDRAPAGEPLLHGDALTRTWDAARDEAIVMAAAAAAGSMAAAIRLTVDYLKVRRQFGTALADFQALQQRTADLFILANEARSSVYAALSALHGEPGARNAAVSGCKIKVARAARHVTGEAVHLHGGIGFSAEYAVGHHYRRALVDAQLFGGEAHHLARYLRATRRQTASPDVALVPAAQAAKSNRYSKDEMELEA